MTMWPNRLLKLANLPPPLRILRPDAAAVSMRELIRAEPTWEIIERYPNCNGLSVLERKP